MNEKCNGLASVQCCNFDVKNCKYRSEEDDCYNPEVVKKALEKQLGRYTIPKRKPGTNGVLELTEEEKAEFVYLFVEDDQYLEKLVCCDSKIVAICLNDGHEEQISISNYEAIDWLLKRFNLTGGE
jgi:hypothetical protein